MAKKDGSTRWAVDYRELNKFTVPDSFPTSNLSQVIKSLEGSEIFSSLDAAQASHNVQINEDSQQITTFICMFGLYQFKRMPFRLKNAGAVYCRLLAKIMQDLGLQSVVHYLDDILIHTKGVDEHIDSLEAVLEPIGQQALN